MAHCSAGCGRTGTFIALDYLLEELERGSFDGELELDPVFETVDYLRKKRVMMVQNVAQFRLIYDTLRWRWNDKHGIGEDIGSNLDYTSVLGGPTRKVKKPRWQGVPQRIQLRPISVSKVSQSLSQRTKMSRMARRYLMIMLRPVG
ncbi:hypothetical protein MMC21_008499 [Puttea exsequens]|nr:hypothetical protein [Puttea exsequens]